MNTLLQTKQIHFIGIGGAGMCPMAQIVKTMGYTVTGSDKYPSATTQILENFGISVQYSHEPELIKKADLCVYSSAILKTNTERLYAQSHSIPCIKRSEMLGDLMRGKWSIAVAGTHGKTTTTALITTIFDYCGYKPTAVIGGALLKTNTHALIGESSIFITEADEYDRSFLQLFPSIAVITNIEADHLDIYTDISEIIDAFALFVQKVPFYGAIFYNCDDLLSQKYLSTLPRSCISYGLSKTADYRAEHISYSTEGISFELYKNQTCLGLIRSSLFGNHNISNICAAIAVSHSCGIPMDGISSAINSFQGVKRRFEILGLSNGITVIDDYAHHPSEIKATFASAVQAGFTRIIVVFQPHLYTRTRDFFNEFVEVLIKADVVILTEIYKAREEPIEGITSEALVALIKARGHAHCCFIPELQKIPEYVINYVQKGDALFLMGAGDINSIGHAILTRIRQK